MGVGVTVQSDSILLEESSGAAAGVYSGAVVVPAGTTIIDVIVHAIAVWAAGTSATLIVGDDTDDDCFFAATNVKATDLTAGQAITQTWGGGKFGADATVDYATVAGIGASHMTRRATTAERTLKAKVTTVGTVGTAGKTRVTFVYAVPQDKTNTFVAT
jgi:hypothetical protein